MSISMPSSFNGKPNFVHIFADATNQHLGKDHCIISNYFGANGGCNAYLVCENWGQEFTSREAVTPNLQILQLSSPQKERPGPWRIFIHQLLFILRNAHQIDILFTCHFSTRAKISAIAYKLRNAHGRMWIKMDASKSSIESQYDRLASGGIISLLKHSLNKFALRSIDFLSVEDTEALSLVNRTYPNESNKILHVPNPINSQLLRAINLPPPTSANKENLIITVARIGSGQKNNEMMLQALSGLNLHDWKFVFIGPIDNSFHSKIKNFYSSNPGLSESVKFTGNIDDKHQLYSWYNRAKVFCLTSQFEANCNAQTDALYFGLFQISTPVSGINDLGDQGRFAKIVHSQNELREILSQIFHGEFNPSADFEAIVTHSRKFYVDQVCSSLLNSLVGK